MRFSEEIQTSLESSGACAPDGLFSEQACERLDRLADLCPVYRNLLRAQPERFVWLEDPSNRDTIYRRSAFESVWRESFGGDADRMSETANRLRAWRRLMSMRIAYREINGLSEIRESLTELSTLAEFCIAAALRASMRKWEEKLGEPWDEALDKKARFCVIGFGKLGGSELNFCSDIDLVFIYEGAGHCRKGGKAGSTANSEFYSRAARDLSGMLQERGDGGFVYNVDLRLRPEGQSGPLVRSLEAMESYYSIAGQTWERLALIKARPVAGDIALGGEFFESLNSFCYPRHPPPGLISEVAGVKLRTEKEVVGKESLARDIKSGRGGIREIEFLAQALQMLNGGRNPFLQTHSTLEALERLERYGHMETAEARRLREAYLFFRTVENRLQMREEKQTHTLPEPGPERELLAQSLGFETERAFDEKLDALRGCARESYAAFFSEKREEDEIQDWLHFFSGAAPSKSIDARLTEWFGRADEDLCGRLRQWVRGAPSALLTREHALLFLDISASFPKALPQLARPLRALERLNGFAERYGARKQFLKMCAQNPSFFTGLCLLFDRSSFIWELTRAHPEILEEIYLTGLRLKKPKETMLQELSCGPKENDESFAAWLWLYAKAEQTRAAIAESLAEQPQADIETDLSNLADAALETTLGLIDPEGELAIIALGKYGGREIIFGSDLDIIILGEKADPAALSKAQRLLKIAGRRGPQGRAFDIDLRLRPFGSDSPIVTTAAALERYHKESAQFWERQMLVRARGVCGSQKLIERFERLREQTVFGAPPTEENVREMWRMKQRVEKEKAAVDPPERAFKAGPGGLIEVEFAAQILQMRHGGEKPEIRSPGARASLAALARAGLMPEADERALLEGYNMLRCVEHVLRRDSNEPVAMLKENDPDERRCLVVWLKMESWESFWSAHTARMAKNREIIARLLGTSADV